MRYLTMVACLWLGNNAFAQVHLPLEAEKDGTEPSVRTAAPTATVAVQRVERTAPANPDARRTTAPPKRPDFSMIFCADSSSNGSMAELERMTRRCYR